MNSKILRPMPKVGQMSINCNGGEINLEAVCPTKAYNCPLESLSLFDTKDLKELIEDINREIALLPAKYSVVNGIVKENKFFDNNIVPHRKALEARRKVASKIIIRRKNNYNRKNTSPKTLHNIHNIESIDGETSYSVITRLSMINQEFDYEIIEKGDENMKNNFSHIEMKEYWIPDYIDKNGQKIEGHYNVVVETIPMRMATTRTRESSLHMKDFFILHKNRRLAIKTPSGKIVSSFFEGMKEDEESLWKTFRAVMNSRTQVFVVLPKGGPRRKQYGENPMIWNDKTEKNYNFVPIDEIVRKVYKPEIDGYTQSAKDVIHEYRGPTDGYAPVYNYEDHDYDFTPDILSYNHIEYGEKMVIILGTQKMIDRIDKRISKKNSVKNQYHKFTSEKIIPYKGQISRCENKRILIDENEDIQVFGLNLRGTPEEDLKGYLRGFDKTSQRRDNEEAKELLEIAQSMDGRQTQENIEHDLRRELKHLKTRTSQELYFLTLAIEEEMGMILDEVCPLSTLPGYVEAFGKDLYKAYLAKLYKPNKKQRALMEVVQSFKSSKEIEEEEGKGLSNDIKDLVTIEKESNDSSYRKSKKLFSQKEGVLKGNQNPLRMKRKVELLNRKGWNIIGGPISFPRNEKIPKRNIRFIKRGSVKTKMFPVRTMFNRDFSYRITINGIKMVSSPSFHSSCKKFNNIFDFVNESNIPWILSKLPRKVKFFRPPTTCHKKTLIDMKKISKQVSEIEVFKKGMTVASIDEVVPTKVKGFKIKNPKAPLKYRGMSRAEWYKQNKGCISTHSHFDKRNRKVPGPVFKKATWEQFVASEQQAYQFSDKKVFKEDGREVKMENGSIIKTGEFVRVPRSSPSSYKIIHTIGDEKGKKKIDCYIIDINGQALYAKGDLSLLEKESISFTGTRNPSALTLNFGRAVVKNFVQSDKVVTVSGGAEGCDTLVHMETIKQGGKTIMVLAGGFNGQYTIEGQIEPETVLKNGGLLLSKHHPEYIPTKKDFVLRNKIIAGLSDRLVVFEAGNGTKHCAKFGVELNKELLVQTVSDNQINLVSRRDYPF